MTLYLFVIYIYTLYFIFEVPVIPVLLLVASIYVAYRMTSFSAS